MAPNKKKRKPVSNPARGFTTVSLPSKKAETVSPEPEVVTEPSPNDGRPTDDGTKCDHPPGSETGTSDLRNMTPEELEQHLEQAELQALLDLHRQRSKRDASRQITRLETERRSLRRSDMTLETESWLPQVMEEILELARSASHELIAVKSSEGPLDQADLCIKLWTLKQVLESLHFRNIDGALKYLISISSVTPKPTTSSMVWGLEEAQHWLALHLQPEDLPGYQETNTRYNLTQSQAHYKSFDSASGEIEDSPEAGPAVDPYSYLP
jgi:ATP-dependent RNA helicase DHX29